MKILLITEKCSPHENQRDGGARLVETLKRAFGDSLSIMQFGPTIDSSAKWNFDYPFLEKNRFERRLANASFIAEKIKTVEHHFTHIIFIHISMQFGLMNLPLREKIEIWTFPMFLSPSYLASGEIVPGNYIKTEKLALQHSTNIITPSHLEKRQLVEFYSVPEVRIHVIPRGIDTQLLFPKIRSFIEKPRFCSIGSIKPQKNILDLISLFKKVHTQYQTATLKIIGPIQDSKYGEQVQNEIQHLGLQESIDLTGYIPPSQLSFAIQDTHLHLSRSACETFGRSIFETLASGLPNVARKTGNAAAEFLGHLPYARFVDNQTEALEAISEILSNLTRLSTMALEIGKLYDDEFLCRLLVAKILKKDFIAISDFDGTLFHKDDLPKTQRSIEAFKNFPLKVICSARPLEDLLENLRTYNLTVDWIIACSGAVIANGKGELLWLIPLNLEDMIELENLIPNTKRIKVADKVIQMAVPLEMLPRKLGLRTEIYQQTAFIAHWEASKFHAVNRLMRYLDWSGNIRIFGDGPYDQELLTYFDGILITGSPTNNRQKKEIEYDPTIL